jgi:hypothetical protein
MPRIACCNVEQLTLKIVKPAAITILPNLMRARNYD